MNTPYPLTIVLDRYTGVYSGGVYTAWNKEPYDIPGEISEDDVTCMEFWSKPDFNYFVGVGITPQEAVDDLKKKLKG